MLKNLSSSFSKKEIEDLVSKGPSVSPNQKYLSGDETESVGRLARVSLHAEKIFGDHDKAAHWLRKPSRALDQQAPIDLLHSEIGAQIVIDLLNQLAYGMFI